MHLPRLMPVGLVTLGVQPWKFRERLSVTVVVKASFELREPGTLVLTDPDPLVTKDVHVDNDPSRSLTECTDLAPHLAIAEALFKGAVDVPRGGRVLARFALARASTMLFDRRVWVTAPPTNDARVRVPLEYERAFGGPTMDDNPVGGTAPLLVDARDPRVVAAFGPIARYWRARARFLSNEDRAGMRGALIELRDDFPWEFFQAAPPWQRFPGPLSGQEIVLLENLWPGRPRVELRLPEVRAEAMVHDSGADRPLPLVGDTLRVDGERGRVTVTFRGSMPHDGSQDRRVVVSARVFVRGQAPPWPAEAAKIEAQAAPTRSKPKTAAILMTELGSSTMPFAHRGAPATEPDDRARAPQSIPGAPFRAPGSSDPPAPPPASVPPPAPISVPPNPVPPPAPVVAPAPPPIAVAVSPAVAAPSFVASPAVVAAAPASRGAAAPVDVLAAIPFSLHPCPPGLAAFGLLAFGATAPLVEEAATAAPSLGGILLDTVVARAKAARAGSAATT